MKTWAWVIAVAFGAMVARADLVGSYKTIAMDGTLSGFDAGDLMYGDPDIIDGDPANSSYQNIYMANDSTYLYIGLQTGGSGGGDINNSYTRNIYLDTDTDSGTGFNSGWMTGGYDGLVQYGANGGVYSVYNHTGATQADWSWGYLGLIDYSYTDSAIELRVSLSALGLAEGDSVRVEFHVTGAGVNVETWANAAEASVGTYQLALVPEPGTAMLLVGGLLALAGVRRKLTA